MTFNGTPSSFKLYSKYLQIMGPLLRTRIPHVYTHYYYCTTEIYSLPVTSSFVKILLCYTVTSFVRTSKCYMSTSQKHLLQLFLLFITFPCSQAPH